MSSRLQTLRLRDLLLLDRIDGLGTLAQVARSLHVTQPAVTQMLKGLEEAFGVPLVERSRRGVGLTAAGRAALVRLRSARHEIEHAHAAAQAALHPVLRVGATPIATLQVLPQAIARLRREQPALRLTLTELGVESLWRDLADGALDVLVGRLPGPQGRAEGLRHLGVGRERMVIIGSARHPLAAASRGERRRDAWLKALADCDWVLPPADALAVVNFNEWFAAGGLRPPVPAVVSGSFYASLNLVARTGLVSLVPESAARALLATLDLRILDSPWGNPPVQVVFASRESNWDSEAVATLRRCFLPEPKAGRTRRGR